MFSKSAHTISFDCVALIDLNNDICGINLNKIQLKISLYQVGVNSSQAVCRTADTTLFDSLVIEYKLFFPQVLATLLSKLIWYRIA